MGPFEKYFKYGRFPFKMVVHFCLALSLICQIFLVVNFNGSYSLAMHRKLTMLLFDENLGMEDQVISRDRFFFSASDLRNHINEIIDNYFGIPDGDSIENYDIPLEINEQGQEIPSRIIMSPLFIRKEDRLPWKFLETNLTYDERGAFQIEEDGTPRLTDDELRDFLSSMSHFTLQFYVRHDIPTVKFTTYDCYRWIITADFTMLNNGHYVQINRMERQF